MWELKIIGAILGFCGGAALKSNNFLGMALIIIGFYLWLYPKDKSHYYTVKELERNTVFTISDKEGAYNVNDTVWVNLSTRKVDTLDSNAMLCVIIKEL